jgi:serine/threonine protein phosphatase PrpC
MKPSFKIQDAAATHVGCVRDENEDSYSRSSEANVWLVADGMGGHQNGSFASSAIVAAVSTAQIPDDLDDAVAAVAAAVDHANAEILATSLEAGAQIGSTFVALVLRDSLFGVLWTGDSRAYVYRGDQLISLTHDHTQVDVMLERGLLTPDEARSHPMRHVLSRAVGVAEQLDIETVDGLVTAQDLFILCSDGLHGVLTDAEIAAILADKGHAACDDLIAACLERGAPDNVTVLLVAANEPTLIALPGCVR